MIRVATADDLATVRRISLDAYVAYRARLGFLPIPAEEDYVPRIARGEVWIAERAGSPAAVAVFETHPDHLLIFSLAVPPEHQGRGLGRAMLAFAETRARLAGVPEIRLYTNSLMERNIGLYRASGYRITGTRPHPTHGESVVVDMAKPTGLPAR